MRINLSLLLLLIVGANNIYAQDIHSEHNIAGYVFERNDKGNLVPIPGAHIYCPKEKKGSVTVADGSFSIQASMPITQKGMTNMMKLSRIVRCSLMLASKNK